LGEVTLADDSLLPAKVKELEAGLTQLGFELIDDRKSRIIEKVKNLVVTMVHHTDEAPREKTSDMIAKELHLDYPYLSKLFSEVEGITIEQYTIQQKVEKVKEYIVYEEITLSEIADRMGYSSVAYLSAQFKKVTGLPPSHFKNLGLHQRQPLDRVGSNRQSQIS
jgi:YesN/AraC family two-component response regulator